MSLIDNYRELNVKEKVENKEPNVYSLTADVISFRRCPRQYLIFRERGFIPPNATQLYFGTVVHQTLDLLHSHYKGLLRGIPSGSMPTEQDVFRYFRTVERGLFARGVRPYESGPRGGSGADELTGDETYDDITEVIGRERASAFCRIRLFNEMNGKTLYPRIVDTECRLDADLKDFIMTGNVDVIATSSQGGRELWDYKSQKSIDLSPDKDAGKDARMQMLIYGHLYAQRTGRAPDRGVIYCLGDIDPKKGADEQDIRDSRIEVVGFSNSEAFQKALNEFASTVKGIEAARENNIWPKPNKDPGKNTCDVCAKRWDCKETKNWGRAYSPRFP